MPMTPQPQQTRANEDMDEEDMDDEDIETAMMIEMIEIRLSGS